MRVLPVALLLGLMAGCATPPVEPPPGVTPPIPAVEPPAPTPEAPRTPPREVPSIPAKPAEAPAKPVDASPPAAEPIPAIGAPGEAAPSPAPMPSPTTVPPTAASATPILPSGFAWLKAAPWKDLPGWKHDDLTQAWPALAQSCQKLRGQAAWRPVCDEARRLPMDAAKLRAFAEARLQAYQISQAEGGGEGLVTGYYEPLLRGSRTYSPAAPYPLLAPPDDLLVVDLAELYPELRHLRLRGRLQGNKVVPYFSRADIEAGKAPLKGREIAWVADAVELFFLQVQGSGRIQLDNGEMMRVGYADQNGHPYRSIGKWLVEQGELPLEKASMQGIKDWGARNPDKLPALLRANPSFVFFRELPTNKGDGPIGSLGVPLTPERSIAVDPRAVPLGAPVWLATTQPNSNAPLQRLVLAQDTGSAIKGNVRADFFWGFGDAAGDKAGAMKQAGRMWLLWPRDETGTGKVKETRLPTEKLGTVRKNDL
jgi:membrane-bound lytic murein transglycosylase A